MDFVAIDFETANSNRSSACALGLTVVEDGKVVDQAYWLIRPVPFEFDPFNVDIHGITEEQVANAKQFPEVWAEATRFVGNRPLVAHNAAFDMSVIRNAMSAFGRPYPEATYICSMNIARATWPTWPSYSLPIVAAELGIDFQHHDAAQDAWAAAQVVLRAAAEKRRQDLLDLANALRVYPGKLEPHGYVPCSYFGPSGRQRRSITSSKGLQPRTDTFDESHPFFGATIVFTGTLLSMTRREAMQLVVDHGGQCRSSVTSRTDFLVVGINDIRKLRGHIMSTKMAKALELRSQGHAVEILSEKDFLEVLNEEVKR